MKVTVLNQSSKDKPQMEITVQRVEPQLWEMFEKHHYLTPELNKSCKCLVFFLDGNICGFCGLLNTPRKGVSMGHSVSRIVVLPEYQGLGLSPIIMNFCGGILAAKGEKTGEPHPLYIKTIHEKMGQWLERSMEWNPTSYNGKKRSKESTESEGARYRNRLQRRSFCFRYDGPPIHGYDDLLRPIGDLRKRKENSKILIKKEDINNQEIKQLELWRL